MNDQRQRIFTLLSEGRISKEEARLLLSPEPPRSDPPHAPIAVIGMAGRFGACNTLEDYWNLIDSGQQAIGPIASHRWPDGGADTVGGFLEQPDLFDPLFFKIAPNEAGLIDPQQRIFLETAWMALEQAALGEASLQGSACGVFVGVGAGDYGRRLEAAGLADSPLALMGNVSSILASRIAYLLDLKGPALAVDTACSSSLVAVHLACESLRRKECDLALAGGVCIINSGRFIGSMSKAGVISKSGRCHAFDVRADGFVCGEGAGAVVLKPLDRALTDGDPILGVILGEGINQDGRTNGITAPSAPSQASLIQRVHQQAGIHSGQIGYIEAHGTGTPLGDPIELEALARVFEHRLEPTSPRIPIGSVKANIGHTLTAAGIAGLIKVLLMMRAKKLPPMAGFETPNPRLQLDTTPFRILKSGANWLPDPEGRRIASVSSFGFSGTNAHLVVASPPERRTVESSQGMLPFFLSATQPANLRLRASDVLAFWQKNSHHTLEEIAYSLACGCPHHLSRQAFMARSKDEALDQLARLAAGEAPECIPDSPAATAWLAGKKQDLSQALKGARPQRIGLPPTRLNPIPCIPPLPQSRAPIRLEELLSEIASLRHLPPPELSADGVSFAKAEDWGRRAALSTLSAHGLFSPSRRVMTRAALAREFGVPASQRGLFDALLAIAEQAQLLTLEGDVVRLWDSPALPDPQQLEQQRLALEASDPVSRPFLSLLKETTRAIAEVVRGQRDGTVVLFPEGRLDLVDAIYQGNRLADYFNQLMAASVAGAVRQLLNSVQGPVRILEIGAGTGGATRSILKALEPQRANILYTFSDVSLGFLKRGRELFGDVIEPVIFNASQPGEAQGLATGEFHLLIASNVLHAVPSLSQALDGLWRLLAPQCVLILNEITAVQDFATLTFGLTPGWWGFVDPERRLPGAPLADPARWRSVLGDTGFVEMHVLTLPNDEAQQQAIMIACRDERQADPIATGPRITLPSLSEPLRPTPIQDNASLMSIVREQVAMTLGVEPLAIDPMGRFMDYGIDSILGQELINRLNLRLGVDLAPTVVFDLPTVTDLAQHLKVALNVKETDQSPRMPTPEARHKAEVPDSFGDLGLPPARSPEDVALHAMPIAVIGMAGRFASAHNLEAFHALLAEGRSGITLARSRLGIDPDHPPEHLKGAAPYLRWGGLLDGIDQFDPTFFRMSGREAELTDPQHRVFLTDAWRALEDAGYAGALLETRECGVFVGCHGGDYTHLMAEKGVVPDAFAFTGNAASILAARIAYLLDLKGPALAVDTACSSSLVAVHLACQALAQGECEMALAGGVFINTTVGFNTAAASAGMLSPSGRCAAFDVEADGFVPGEGSGVVVLKPLARAVADGDTVIAVIQGSATNQDGKTNGITAPSATSQAALIQKALKRAGIEARDVNYIETHGTGTRLGDPIEIEGLKRGFAIETSGMNSCLIGSVKSNVGHAAHAAGVAGLIKVLLSFRHDEIYPSLHFHQSNPQLKLDKTPFSVNTRLRPWPPETGRRVACISSFGFSGTNCHLVLSDPQPLIQTISLGHPPGALVTLSARSASALDQQRLQLATWLRKHPTANLHNLAFTLGVGRAHFDHRWAACVSDIDALEAALDIALPGSPKPADPRMQALAEAMGRYLEGSLPDFLALHPGCHRIPLPTYPFEETTYWVDAPPSLVPPTQPQPDFGSPHLMDAELFVPVWGVQDHPPRPRPISPDAIHLLGDPQEVALLAPVFSARGIEVLPEAASRMDGQPKALTVYLAPREAVEITALEPVFACFKRHLETTSSSPLRLILVHDGSPLFAATIAAAPSLKFVSDQIHLSSLELPPSLNPVQTAEWILSAAGSDDQEIQIRVDGTQTVRSMQPLSLETRPLLNLGGVWLITGGLGGLGPLFARHLAMTQGARIGLVGRSALTPQRLETLRNLRHAGVQVHYVRADVTDRFALSQAVQEIEQILGPIRNVIHAAGIPSTLSLTATHWDAVAATLSGKVEGARHLDEILAHHPLRHLILFSSIASEYGDFGQCDYAVANAFLNRFAQSRNRAVERGERQGHTLSVAWPIWEGGHAALSVEGERLIGQTLGIRPLEPALGIHLLEQILAHPTPLSEVLVVMASARKNHLLPSKDERMTEPLVPAAEIQPLLPVTASTPPAKAEVRLRHELTMIISRLLKLNPARLQGDAGLGDFGFDSIVLKEFAQTIATTYQIDFSPAVFFAHGSINALSNHLLSEYPGLLNAPTPKPSTPSISPEPDPMPPVSAPESRADAIAIIGLSGRFPGGDDLESFWEVIESGGIVVGPMPEDRRQLLGLQADPLMQAGFINEIDRFDAGFFKMSMRESVHMDPQHRLALVATWQALENAALVPDCLSGTQTAVFLGQQISGYAGLLAEADPEATAQAVLGNVNALMPNRISHHFNWHGPSESIDTACSSSLVAVHRAMRALRSGECDLAIAGGTSLLLDLKDLRSTESLGILSSEGRCRTFDTRANGYVKGEGVGVVVLKRHADALRDGDPIHAILRGSAVNHGGRAQSLTAPNPLAQRDLIRAALNNAQLKPCDLSYVETHGTGTELGDPVEVDALKAVFKDTATASVALGAVKANIGHLEPASGIAALMKVVLALKHRTIPPVAGLQEVNPLIQLDGTALTIPLEKTPWPAASGDQPRRAGVSSFGFGGTNAHIIVEEAILGVCPPGVDSDEVLLLSAPDPVSLEAYARRLAHHLKSGACSSLADLAFTLMGGRSALPTRATLEVQSLDEAESKLLLLAEALSRGSEPPDGVHLGTPAEGKIPGNLGQDPEDHAFFQSLASAGQLQRLARFWVDGIAIDWSSIGQRSPARRIHLPGVPIRPMRCWFEARLRPTPAGVQPPVTVTAPTLTLKVHPLRPSVPSPASTGIAMTAPPTPRALKDVTDQIRTLIADALYIASDHMDDQARFMDLGLDSILAVEVTRQINQTFQIELTATRLYDYPSVADLAGHVLNCCAGGTQATLAGHPTEILHRPTAPAGPNIAPSQPSGVSDTEIASIRNTVHHIIAGTLYIDPEQLSDETGFVDLGLDSILAVEVANRLNAELGTDLQATRLYDHPTISDLATYLQSRCRAPAEGAITLDDPVLASLKHLVAQGTGVEAHAIASDLALDRLAIGPEQAMAILQQIEKIHGVLLTPAEVASCPHLQAVAELIHARSGTGVPLPVKPVPSLSPMATPAVPVTPPAPPSSPLHQALAELLMLKEHELPQDVPLMDLGLDPVMAEELSSLLQRSLGPFAPSARTLLSGRSLHELSRALPNSELPPTPMTTVRPDAEPSKPPASDALGVAVTGIACRYPGAKGKDAFWQLLHEGRSGITAVPTHRWNPDDYLKGLPLEEQRRAVRWGGFVDDIDRFDPLFFNLSPREAEMMDPQQRLFLEEAWHAFEDAGLTDVTLKGSRCGIFIGVGQGDYSRRLPSDEPSQISGQFMLGNTSSILVSRIAYLLDLRGPAVAIDTACSSALVATELAYRAIRENRCDMALVGGINLMTTPQMHVMTAASGMLSPEGQCRTFDQGASGFVPGEGIGLLVLRRLDQAQASGDRIYGLIRGAGINQDGKTSGITAPSSISQESLHRSVWQECHLDPEQFGYIEAHGTATRLGDPIEIDALTRAFSAMTDRRNDCPIGSVKTNIGHTLASAGAAGLIKTLLALHHRWIPPSLNFETPNALIDFPKTPFFVPTQGIPWNEKRLAGVNSFGFSGTNAHIVVEGVEAPPASPAALAAHPTLFVLSGRDRGGLIRQTDALLKALEAATCTFTVGDLAHTLATRRSHMEVRLALVATGIPELREGLAAWRANAQNALTVEGKRKRNSPAVPPLSQHPASLPVEALIAWAQSWCEGGAVTEWPFLDQGQIADIPGTAFAGLRCWYDGSETKTEPLATPSTEAPRDHLRLTAEDAVMRNHRVAGQAVLPGMASLILLRQDALRLGYAGAIRHLKWLAPVVAPCEIRIETQHKGESLLLELHTQDGRVVACATADRIRGLRPMPVEVKWLHQDVKTQVPISEIYTRLQAGAIHHGDDFCLLDQVGITEGQVLARLKPAQVGSCAPLAQGEISPATLDAALHALAALDVRVEGSVSQLLPAGLEQFDYFDGGGEPVWAWLTVDAGKSGPDRLTVDARLLDESGQVIVELLGFEARAAQPSGPEPSDTSTQPIAMRPAHPAPIPAHAHGAQDTLQAERILLQPYWEAVADEPRPFDVAPIVLCSGIESHWANALARRHQGTVVRIDTMSPESIAETIAGLSPSMPLVFAAWQEPKAPRLTPGRLIEAERRGLQKLRGLLQGMARRSEPGRLVILTRGAQAVMPNERMDPTFAALIGFAQSAARELTGLELECTDLPLDPGHAIRGWDLDGYRWVRQTGLFAYREGVHLRQSMFRMTPDEDQWAGLDLPKGAVCLMAGGAGGLGRATSLWLATKCQARIAWVGRRPADDAITAALTDLANHGGEGIYLQADISDPIALAKAIAEVRQRWGKIHLAWHGSMVLHDKSIRNLTSRDIDRVMAPKSLGLLNLITALSETPPDHFCLCSSANAFTVNPGQASYAAASAFVDALALAQIQARGWHVSVINWGIWGETGIVAEPQYLERARRAGVEPLSTAEALATFGWALQAGPPQIVPLQFSRSAAHELAGSLLHKRLQSQPPASIRYSAVGDVLEEAFTAEIGTSFRVQAEALGDLIRYGRERLFSIYAVLGLDHQAPNHLGNLGKALGIIPERLGLFHAHLEILARCGLLTLSPESDPWVELSGPLPNRPPETAPEASHQKRLIDLALDGTPDVLTGVRLATDVLFPGGRNDTVEAVYRDDRVALHFNQAMGRAAAALGNGEPLRILEIGAGTGSVTDAVLASLESQSIRFSYTFSDVSSHFVSQAQSRYGHLDAMDFKLFNISQPPRLQGFEHGRYDLVIAANVMHVLPSVVKGLMHVKMLLKPQGAVLLLEATARSDFATFTFGLTDGWWAHTDPEWRIPHSPLLSSNRWHLAASTVGLNLESIGQFKEADGQSILLYSSDGWQTDTTVEPMRDPTPAAEPESTSVEGLSLDTRIVRIVCQVLRMEASDMDPDEPLERYGVDSLVVNELHAALTAELGPVPRTWVYEANTLRMLSERFMAEFHSQPTIAASSRPLEGGLKRAPTPEGAIAIIGVSGRFPGAGDVKSYWHLLQQGLSSLGDLPPDRKALWPDGESFPGGYLDDVAGFDSLFFNISPSEAQAMDPQERLFLESAWACFEDAGRLPEALKGRVGVFAGVMGKDYLRLSAEGDGQGDTPAWSVANRVSYVMNLTGPSLAIDTACSSGLSALHLATTSLMRGECDAALAGAVHLILHPASRTGLRAMGMLSHAGRARPFSQDADGLVGGEGVCCLLLRRLEDAIASGDRILGVIRSTGIAANGRTRNYMAPNSDSLARGLREFRALPGWQAPDYIECQAMGSPVNDPIIVSGLAEALLDLTVKTPIGSVEGSIGHLEAVSGLAQITKVLGMFQFRSLLPTVGLGTLHAEVQAAARDRFEFVDKARPWDLETSPVRALVQSLGAGGGSAYALIESPPPRIQHPQKPRLQLIPVSARTQEDLQRSVENLLNKLTESSDLNLAALAYTLQTGRMAFEHRLAAFSADVSTLRQTLTQYLNGKSGDWIAGIKRGAPKSDLTNPSHLDPRTLAQQWVSGQTIPWAALWSESATPIPVALPTYPFNHRNCWLNGALPVADLTPENVTEGAWIKEAFAGLDPAPTQRKLVIVPGPSEPDDLGVYAEPLAPPAGDEVLIAIDYAGVNFADLLCTRGQHPNLAHYPHFPGYEVAGTVLSTGPSARGFIPGQKVMALTGGQGGFATHVKVPAHWAVKIPVDFPSDLAAATPVGYLTASYVMARSKLRAGETLLIQSAAGGTGPFMIQLALERGATVIATAGTATKLKALKAMGVKHLINYRKQDFYEAVQIMTQGRGVDVVISSLGGDAIQKGIDLLAPGGRYCEIALAGLAASAPINLSRLIDNQSVMSINLGRVLADPKASEEAMAEMATALTSGRVKPIISRIYPMGELPRALRALDQGDNVGKVLLKPDDRIEPVSRPLVPLERMDSTSNWKDELIAMTSILLGLDPKEIDVHVPLENFGLNSIVATQLMREIYQRFGIAAPIQVLYEAQSIDGLIRRLRAEARTSAPEMHPLFDRHPSSRYDPVIPIRTHEGGIRSFWVHGAPGDASWVLRLASRLPATFSVYGIEARGLADDLPPHDSVIQMASAYVEGIRRVQSEGPYFLGAYSGGGVIALEMIRLLEVQGQRVEKLVLLDAIAPGSNALQGMRTAYDEHFITTLAINWFGRTWGMPSPFGSDDAVQETPDAFRERGLDHLYRHAQPPIARERLDTFIQGMNRTAGSIGKAIQDHRASPLSRPVDTLLIACAQRMGGNDNPYHLPAFLSAGDYTEGWSAFLGATPKRKTLDCDHFSLLDSPWLDQLIQQVTPFFNPLAVETTYPDDIRAHVHDVVNGEVRRVLRLDPSRHIAPDMRLSDLGAHSVDRAEIAASAMERLNIHVPLSVLSRVANLEGLIEVLSRHVSDPQDA